MIKLSEEAWKLLTTLRQGTHPYIPKSTVERQWDPKTRQLFQEILDAGLAEEITVYRIKLDRQK